MTNHTEITETTESFTVCDECSAAITNDDWTAIDEYCESEEESIDEHSRRLASVESMGLVTMSHRLNGGTIESGHYNPGYFTCHVCGAVEIGGYVWESEK